MENQNTKQRTVEAEFKKGMLRNNVPIGLAVTAIGLFMVVLVGGYLVKYFRGAIPLRDIYGTGQVEEEYVSFDVNYVMDAFLESYRTRNGGRTKNSVYYLVLDEELGVVPVRVSAKMEEEMDRIMEHTWDYLSDMRPDPPKGIHIEGTMKKLEEDGKKYFDQALESYELETEDESCYLWAGMLDNQSPASAMAVTGLGAVFTLVGLCILASMLKKHHVIAVQTFLDSHGTVSRERLDEDFQRAKKISSTFWLGEDLSYGISGGPVILDNQEIKKVWFRVRRVGRTTKEELVCTMKDGNEYGFAMNKKKADEAKALYFHKYPDLKMAAGLGEGL